MTEFKMWSSPNLKLSVCYLEQEHQREKPLHQANTAKIPEVIAQR